MIRLAGVALTALLAACGDAGGPAPAGAVGETPPAVVAATAPAVEVLATAPLEGTEFEALDVRVGDAAYRAYLRRAESEAPLLLFVQGSGCDPLFTRTPDGTWRGTAGQNPVAALAGDRFHVLAVDKLHAGPAEPGSQSECSEAFRKTHSIDHWTAALEAVATVVGEHVDATPGLRVLGLSEGAVSAARLARDMDGVSQVAFISGHGCHQLDDMLVRSRRDWLASNPDATDAERQAGVAEAAVYQESVLAEIFSDPDDWQRDIWGQTALFWSTFGMACPARDLAESDAEVFLAYGTEDEQVVADGLEEIVTRRIAAGKTTDTLRVVGGSHVLTVEGDANPYARLLDAFRQALDGMVEPPQGGTLTDQRQ